MADDVLSVELEITDAGADVVLSRSKQKLEDFIKTAEKAQPQIKFNIPNQNFIDLEKLEKRANETLKSFTEIGKTRLDAGQVGHLTQDIVRTSERARQLQSDISNIKKELANPNRTSSIAFLTTELRAAEREADSLSRKLKTVTETEAYSLGRKQKTVAAPAAVVADTESSKQSGFGRIRGFGAIFRAADLGINESELNAGLAAIELYNEHLATATSAKTALTAATTAEAAAATASTAATTAEGTAIAATTTAVEAETTAFAGLTTVSLGIFAAVAAVGFLAVKASQDYRAESEKSLEVQNKITGELNKQRLAAKELAQNFAEQSANAARSDNFSRSVSTDNLEQLTRRRDQLANSIEQNRLLKISLLNTSFGNPDKIKALDNDDANDQREKLDVESRIRNFSFEKNKALDDAFNKHNEDFKKSQADDAKFQLKKDETAAAATAKKLQEVDKAKTKIAELEQQYLLTFDKLTAKAAADNPFVAVFTDADRSLRELKSNLRGLPQDLQNIAVALQQKINFRQLLEAQTNNQLSAFDLREQANNFRNPFDGDKQKKDQDEFVKRFLQNNPNYLYLQNKTSLDEETRSKILKQFAPSALNETPADRLNKSLDEKFNLLYKPGQTVEQQTISDKKFIAATNGVNPLDLNKDLRESAALVREREAIRQEKYQTDALEIYRKQLKTQEAIAANTANQRNTAERDGGKSLTLTIKDERDNGSAALQKSATLSDTAAAYYNENDPNYRIGEIHQAGSLYGLTK